MRGIGFIEKYVSGIYMINELCEEWGIPKPEYELSEVETKVIFRSGGNLRNRETWCRVKV